MAKKINVSIGIFAYNEEKNLEKTVNSIFKQNLEIARIKEILIISSGSNDHTNTIARKLAKKDSRVKLLDQLRREGKSAAINLFVRKASSSVLLAVSADLRLRSDAVEEITLPFLHEDVGMVGAHPIPSNSHLSSIGKEVKLLWELHHYVSLKHPKCGEMVAFRNVIHSIPEQSAVDEATLEVLLKLVGYKVVYAPRAIVYNKAPLSTEEFLTQRRRVYAGHQWISAKYNYRVSTMGVENSLKAILEYLLNHPTDLLPLLKLLALEGYGRMLGWIDFHIFGRNPYVWKMVNR
ncbi:MAG: glycosyltransferase [Patescibacteria group bacterium]